MGYTYGAYETLIVCGSYEGDLEAIAEVLNGFIFDQDNHPNQRFVVHDGRIQPDRFDIEGASAAFPRTNDDDYEEVSLAELSRTIAPLLKRGTLELVSIGHYNSSISSWKHLPSIRMAACNDTCRNTRVPRVTSGIRARQQHISDPVPRETN